MKKHLTWFFNSKTEKYLLYSIVLFFSLWPLIRLYPFDSSLVDILITQDDWAIYAQQALDIKYNGLLMPSVNGIYLKPAGFLYNYFLAACFTIFGNHTAPVFTIQSILLGFSVVLYFKAFRNMMGKTMRILYLFAAVALAFLDIGINYSYQFLSENLVVFLLSLFFYSLSKWQYSNKTKTLLLSVFWLSLSVLTRPNLILFALFFICLVLVYNTPKSKRTFWLVILVFLVGLSPLAIRNLLVSGNISLLPLNHSSFSSYFFNDEHGVTLAYYFKKTAFIFGFFGFLEPNYFWRPHWAIMGLGYFAYLIYLIRNKKKPLLLESTTHIFIISYYLFLIIIALNIGNYGYRFIIPVLLIILPFPFIFASKAHAKLRK